MGGAAVYGAAIYGAAIFVRNFFEKKFPTPSKNFLKSFLGSAVVECSRTVPQFWVLFCQPRTDGKVLPIAIRDRRDPARSTELEADGVFSAPYRKTTPRGSYFKPSPAEKGDHCGVPRSELAELWGFARCGG